VVLPAVWSAAWLAAWGGKWASEEEAGRAAWRHVSSQVYCLQASTLMSLGRLCILYLSIPIENRRIRVYVRNNHIVNEVFLKLFAEAFRRQNIVVSLQHTHKPQTHIEITSSWLELLASGFPIAQRVGTWGGQETAGKIAYHVSHTMYRISCIVYHVSYIMYRISCLAYHVSHITYRISCIAGRPREAAGGHGRPREATVDQPKTAGYTHPTPISIR